MRALALLLALAASLAAQEEEGAGGEEAKDGGLGALGGVLSGKPDPIDFGKVDRTIRKLPELGKPLYGLFLFGIDGETRVWAVLDAGAKGYDVLYLDRNADGDLTGKEERIAAGPDAGVFAIGDFKEPHTDVVHTGFTLTWTAEGVRWAMRWAGESATSGACAFEPTPKGAPIFVPGTERPFDFAWAGGALERGKENDFRVRIGNRGDRDAAFSWVDETFLPEGEKVLVRLVCKDASGTERKLSADLRARAPGGIYHGPVKIPKDAAKGPATVQVRLPDSSSYESNVTTLPVTLH
jgi:hypothetical protein